MPNAPWCADVKGEFKLGNGCRCYPVTVPDYASDHRQSVRHAFVTHVPGTFRYAHLSGRRAGPTRSWRREWYWNPTFSSKSHAP